MIKLMQALEKVSIVPRHGSVGLSLHHGEIGRGRRVLELGLAVDNVGLVVVALAELDDDKERNQLFPIAIPIGGMIMSFVRLCTTLLNCKAKMKPMAI